MSKVSNAVLGVVAGALALGAVQLEHARSGTLPSLPPEDAMLRPATPAHNVDRSGKGDRLGPSTASGQASFFFVYPPGAPGVLIAARVNPSASNPAVATPRKEDWSQLGESCEPLVSILAATAEDAAPGRCLT